MQVQYLSLKERIQVEEKSVNKRLYKIELIVLKLLPFILALCHVINVILSYYNLEYRIINYLANVSILPLIFIYISSYVFKFCSYHRIFLHYVVLNNLICVYDVYFGIPISDFNYLVLHLVIIFLILLIATYLYVKHNKINIVKNNR